MNLPKNNFKSRKENIREEGLITNLNLTAVYVVEKNPPLGEEGLEWMLLTNLSVKNFDEAVEKVRWYCLRWKIGVSRVRTHKQVGESPTEVKRFKTS